MLYILLDNNQIKLLHVKKSLLGQYDAAFYQKKFQMDLLNKGSVVNLDLIASAVKEGINSLSTVPLKEKDITLILPQDAFAFFRTDMPIDVAATILNSYIREKARTQTTLDLENSTYDYIIQENEDKKKILFYGISNEYIENIQQPFKLLDLRVVSIIPEPLTYFKLFEKTLRKDKKENIFYVSYSPERLIGHVYDSFGLLDANKWQQDLKKDSSVEDILKDKALDYETQAKKLNRLILSGDQSETIRQDTFTKQVGVWTNPLKRIIPNFYQDYVKMLNTPQNEPLPILDFDACVGAFIFSFENRNFSLLNKQSKPGLTPSLPSMPKVNIPFKLIGFFILSFGLSFGLFFLASRMNFKGFSFSMPTIAQATPTPTPSPTPEAPTPTPTPEIDRAELRIKILNGTGISGKAGTVRSFLQEKGYENFVVGNAPNFDYEVTEIQIIKTKPELKGLIEEDIKENVPDAKFTEIDEETTSDIVVIIGKDFK